MSRSGQKKAYFKFNKGKITEASPLTYPENSMKDELNIDLNYDGSIQRRRGLDYEAGYSKDGAFSKSLTTGIQTYLWENAGSLTEEYFAVVKVGNQLRFYDANQDSLSANLVGTLDLTTFSKDSYYSAFEPVQFEKARGFLFMVGKYFEPIYVEYDGSSFSGTKIDIKIRDLEGTDDGLDEGERPGSLTNAHKYNLINQGWPEDLIKVTNPGGYNTDYAWNTFYKWIGSYPSNSDAFPGPNNSTLDRYTASKTRSENVTTGAAAKGHYILDAFNQDRSTVSGISGFTVQQTDERPTAVGFFQGHVLFGGVDFGPLRDTIFISQSLTSIDKAGKCFSVNDPTENIESSPLDTDGGFIRIEGLGKVVAIKNATDSAIIISENGVWALRSSDTGVFSVNNVVQSKISKSGGIGANSAIDFEDGIFFFGYDGIYLVTKDQSGLNIVAQNITQYTIQRDYLDITDLQKKYSFALSDTASRKIYWFYNSNLSDTNTFLYSYNRALIFDVRSQAFYDYEIADLDTDTPIVVGGIFKKNLNISQTQENVIVGADTVTVSADPVYVNVTTFSSSTVPRLKIATLAITSGTDYGLVFSEFKNRNLVDWETEDGVGKSYSSYLETGYEILDNPMVEKQATWIVCYFNRTETSYVNNGSGGVEFDYPSSCNMKTKWEWTSSDSANRWGTSQQVYRFRAPYTPGSIGSTFDYGYDVVVTKNKARGRGKALSIRFESEAGKDFQLLGWAIPFTEENQE